IAARRSDALFVAAAGALALLVGLLTFKRPIVPGFGKFSGTNVGGELYFTATPGTYASGPWLFVLVFLIVVLIHALVAQRTATVFRTLPPLRAYTLDIAGSLAGIITFMLLSWLELPAWSWLLALAPLFVLASGGSGWPRWIPPLAVAAACVFAER